MIRSILTGFFLFLTVGLYAQQKYPIGTWIDYLPYKNVRVETQSEDKIYTATDVSLYSVDKNDFSIEKISKCTGLSDLGFSSLAYDKKRQLLVIAYSNSNIDIYKSGNVINLSDIETKNIPGDKNIYNIYIYNNYAYLACGFGIEVLDLDSLNFYDTYIIGSTGNSLKVNQVAADNNYLYAASDSGLLRADINNPFLSDFNSWVKLGAPDGLPINACQHIIAVNDTIYALFNGTIYRKNSPVWDSIFQVPSTYTINDIYISDNLLYVSSISSGPPQIDVLNLTTKVDSIIKNKSYLGYPEQVIVDEKKRIWLADFYQGLSYGDLHSQNIIYPNGPGSNGVWQLDAYAGDIFVAPGGLNGDGGPAGDRDGFFIYHNDFWSNYNEYNTPILGPFNVPAWGGAGSDSLLDLISVAHDRNTGKTYYTSFTRGGIVEVGDTMRVYKQGVVSFDPNFNTNYPTYSCSIDVNGNLWASNPTTQRPLVAKTPDGTWYSFQMQGISNTIGVGKIYADRYNQVWIMIPGNGLLVYNYGANLASQSDDQYKRIIQGVGSGNLPDPTVNAMVLDKIDEMWLGTDQGIAVIYCPFDLFQEGGCDAQQIIVEGADSIPGYLLMNERVTALDIDAGDRKWVGTENGIWLFSEDGTKQIFHFTTDNSPLFSNTITSLKVDDNTGIVYIGTDKGLMAYQGDATIPSTLATCNMLVFPNPVKHDYTGPIAFRDLPYNATVKISDTEGQLVYQTTANGGTATWNGNNYLGERAHTGIYYVTASAIDSNNNESKCISKLIFVK